jgi:hypothetical protein
MAPLTECGVVRCATRFLAIASFAMAATTHASDDRAYQCSDDGGRTVKLAEATWKANDLRLAERQAASPMSYRKADAGLHLALSPGDAAIDDALEHGGGLNACGCHFNRKTGACHCHQDRGCGCECQPARCP